MRSHKLSPIGKTPIGHNPQPENSMNPTTPNSIPVHVDIIASNAKGNRKYTLPGTFISHTGGPIAFTSYCQSLGIKDGKAGRAARKEAELAYGKLRQTYETVSCIAWSELKRGKPTIRRVAVRPLTDRKTRQPNGVHAVNIGLEIDAPADVTSQLENARLTSKAIRAASLQAAAEKAKAEKTAKRPSVVVKAKAVKPAKATKLSKSEQAAIAAQLVAEQAA